MPRGWCESCRLVVCDVPLWCWQAPFRLTVLVLHVVLVTGVWCWSLAGAEYWSCGPWAMPGGLCQLLQG